MYFLYPVLSANPWKHLYLMAASNVFFSPKNTDRYLVLSCSKILNEIQSGTRNVMEQFSCIVSSLNLGLFSRIAIIKSLGQSDLAS